MTTSFLHLDNVSRRYGKIQALKDINLTVSSGRIGLLGPNGAGKSTLLKILLGLLAPSTGRGTVLGHPILPPDDESHLGRPLRAFGRMTTEIFGPGDVIRRAIGYMSEADALVPGLRGADYVALAGELYGMPRKQAKRRAHEVLTYMGLEDARYRRLEEYSTGMKQRLKLAQALVHDPPVLLLDEPTSGMDPEGRDGMLRLLLTLATEYGKTVLMCTHLLGDVEQVCETVIILYQGRVLCHGKVRELCRSRHDRYRLHIQGNTQEFVRELCLEDAEILHDNGKGEVRVRVPDGWVTRAFYVLADNTGVTIRGLRRDDEDLGEMFYRVIAESSGEQSGAAMSLGSAEG